MEFNILNKYYSILICVGVFMYYKEKSRKKVIGDEIELISQMHPTPHHHRSFYFLA